MDFHDLIKTLSVLNKDYGLQEIVVSQEGHNLMKYQCEPYLFKPLQDEKQFPNIESFDRIGNVKIFIKLEHENPIRHLTNVGADTSCSTTLR